MIRRVGADSLLVEVADASTARELAAWARDPARAWAVDAVPGACTVLLEGVGDVGRVAARVESWTPSGSVAVGDLVELPTTYDGEDLDDVARRWGMTREEAIGTHSGLVHVVEFCGFAPGFGYLSGLPERLAVPRLDTPRTSVPAGSVAVSGAMTGVYPSSSPGGWRLLGHTERRLWSATEDPPALLVPGTRVRFVRG